MRGEFVELSLEHALVTEDQERRELVPEHPVCAVPVPLQQEVTELREGLPVVARTHSLVAKERVGDAS
jgi:hypothetical protein